jgi:glycosyltransferase involved in cell wall biosynthesis
MHPTPWLWLYRPAVPCARAQSVQVLHMAHAMASRGHPVTLAAEPLGNGSVGEGEALGFYGLEPVRTLRLRMLPCRRTAASLAWRALVARWVLRNGRRGVVYARSKRYAREVLRSGIGVRLVLEAHEVDSLLATDRGEASSSLRALEAEVLRGAAGVVANSGGTLRLLRSVHPDLPPARALHNGTRCASVRPRPGAGEGIGYVGSVRSFKDLDTLARAAAGIEMPVHLVGATPADPEVERLRSLSGGRMVIEPPISHRDVIARLAAFRVLVLPVGRGLFGEHLTSPLKLQDYFASGVPVVAADTPAIRDAAGEAFLPYSPGDVDGLCGALTRLYRDEALRRVVLGRVRVRTWAERAAEVEAFVEGLG